MKQITTLLLLLAATSGYGQTVMKIHKNDSIPVQRFTADIDSIHFSNAGAPAMYIRQHGNTVKSILLAEIDSVTHSPHLCDGCGGLTTFSDIDGNIYNTVQIGAQCWIRENLKTGRYRDGSEIPNIRGNATWAGLTFGAWCNFENNAGHDATYGKLYNWYAVADPRNVCPEGWHVPTDAEWKAMELYLGMSPAGVDSIEWRGESANVGGKLKATTGWSAANTGATNSSCYTGLPGGGRYGSGTFGNVDFAGWWNSSADTSTYAWARYLISRSRGVGRNLHFKAVGSADPGSGGDLFY